MKNRAIILLVIEFLFSFWLVMFIVSAAYDELAPRWLFGKAQATSEHIKLIEHRRHYLRFSNDPTNTVRVENLRSLNIISGVARIVLVAALFWLLVVLSHAIAKRMNPIFADEIKKLTKLHIGKEYFDRR